mgnify:CR=1 FL=1
MDFVSSLDVAGQMANAEHCGIQTTEQNVHAISVQIVAKLDTQEDYKQTVVMQVTGVITNQFIHCLRCRVDLMLRMKLFVLTVIFKDNVTDVVLADGE